MIRDTVDRSLALFGPDRIRVVASAPLTALLSAEIEELPAEAWLVEPVARGTGPALALAAREISAAEPNAAMVSMHADHVIRPLEAFRATVARAIEAATTTERLFCIGARPDRAETGYGYMKLGEPLGERTWKVDRFVEKPDPETAQGYVEAGTHLWNTGIFVWRCADLLEAIRSCTPEMAPALPRLESYDVSGFFEAVDPVSIDVGVMERAPNVGVVEAEFTWDDVGVWNALARTRPTDAHGNTVVGRARLLDASENVVWTEGVRATLCGVEGLVVVESGGELLVTTRECSADLKTLLARMDAEAS